MDAKLSFGIIILSSCLVCCHLFHNPNSIREQCPRLFGRTFKGCIPKGNISAGTYEEMKDITKLKSCVLKCCSKDTCNVAFMHNDKCYHITCNSNELCMPTPTANTATSDNFYLILVKPTDDQSWEDILQGPGDNEQDKEIYSILNDRNRFEDAVKDLMREESFERSSYCEVGIENACLPNEECVPQHAKSRAGVCQCLEDYIRKDGVCFPVLLDDASIRPVIPLLTERILKVDNNTIPVTPRHLTVKAESAEVRLPSNEVTLVASVDGQDDKYQFEWTSLHQPDGSKAVKEQNGGQLHLDKLVEGVYSFKVSASTETAYGETFVNVTVLAAKRVNKPPKIIITPANQTIKQPNSAAVLDASSSTDDDGIVSWQWELQQGPLGYEPQLKDSSTLQLSDLTKPGNYTFKLTVTDTDKATSSATANITVLAGIDYPPEANAGEEKIIYLPQNSITLSGNLSRDDNAITTWEWTKSADDAQKAVDMQDTRTPYLHLSNLQEGIYAFNLKVTDSANQSSTAQVHVFVKPPTNKPPVASAGANATISLPQTWIVLDASNSSDDNKIIAYKWEQVEGPSTVAFDSQNSSKTNVTGLTKGVYCFKVTVADEDKNAASDKVYVTVNQNSRNSNVTGLTKGVYCFKVTVADEDKNAASDKVYVTVNQRLTKGVDCFKVTVSDNDKNAASYKVYVTVSQNKNQKPTADAGKDFEVELPRNAVMLNGSNSRDDWAVVKWKWTRDENSMAFGKVAETTDEAPVLILTDLVVGKYTFNLTVSDEQGLTDTDSVSFVVRNDPKYFYLVEMTVDLDSKSLTEAQLGNLKSKLALLVRDGHKLKVRNVRAETKTSKTTITFYVEDAEEKPTSANDVVQYLRQKLRVDASLLGFSVAKLQTTICQNNCSGHGVCDEITRACTCEAFWMQNMFKVYLEFDEDSDCSWSILYVILGVMTFVLLFLGSLWGMVHLCQSACAKRESGSKPTSYKLIEDSDDLPPFAARKSNVSDSDTDSDVVFESRSKPPRFGDSRNGYKGTRNGYAKQGRRVKT